MIHFQESVLQEEATQCKNEIIDSTGDFMEDVKLKSRLEEQIRLQKFHESNFDRELKLQNFKMENHISRVSKVHNTVASMGRLISFALSISYNVDRVRLHRLA